MKNSPPDRHDLEISVFGPGAGECVVVHVGEGDWIVVDSCIDRKSGHPIALDYLKSIGVDPGTQIKLVVATHWHDDHIHGMGELLEAAASARFADSTANCFAKLLEVVELGSKLTARSSVTREFDKIKTILESRRVNGQSRDAVGPMHAIANRKLLALDDPDRSIVCEVFSLSPADGVINRETAELNYALSEIQNGRRPARQGPNQLSVVLWLKVGALNVLLGADLEHVSGITEGWKAITNSGERPSGHARFVKVPHHGSENADCPECWTELISENPIAVLTPYASSHLPKKSDIERMCKRTPQIFLTGDPTKYSVPRRDNAVDRTLREAAIRRRSLGGQMGHVRLRCDARTVSVQTQIELLNGAKRACAG